MAVYETSSPHSHPPLSSPVGSRVWSEDATPSPASPAQLWSQVSVSNSPGPACTVPGGLARAPQAVSLAPEDYQTRLRDSVRPASPQVQGHSVHLSVEQGCPCLACRSRGPTGEGRDRAGPSSRDEVRVLQPLLICLYLTRREPH